MDFSEEKISEVRDVVFGIMDKIKLWDEHGAEFAFALEGQLKLLNRCGHEGAAHKLHEKEIEALEYVCMALNVLGANCLENVYESGNDRNKKGKKG